MPKKGADRRKGRRSRNIVASNNSGSNPSSGVKTSPQQTRGRSTKNSTRGRNNPARSSSVPSQAKKTTSSRSGSKKLKSSHSPDRPTDYTSADGEVYRPGDFAYVDSQQPELPYHICLIRSFKVARKESIVAEVKWFYRVSELPEAVYCLLMDDRKKGKSAASFEQLGVKERELFTAFNIDTHPATLFKGKCVVEELTNIKNLSEFIRKSNHFFYQHGYKPESRRITQLDEFSIIPQSQQAILPLLISSSPKHSPSVQCETEPKSDEPLIDRYKEDADQKTNGSEELVWHSGIEDEKLLMFVRAARSIALHAGLFMNGLMRDGYMAASSDETTQHAFDVLHRVGYNTDDALVELVKKPIVGRLYNKRNWSKEHSLLFAKGMRQFGKNFYKIKKELLPNKEIHELVEYYYYWKKTNAGLSSRNTRKQRKQTHIRMSRNSLKQPEVSPEREFIDLSSASEDEVENEDGDKCLSFHACRHCYTTESSNWHHAGNSKAILCEECRVHFQKYGCMKNLSTKREPPDFMFKDYHLALAEEGGRKTRNSNGIRLPRTGLRNGKVFSKSDSDEEDEGDITDTSEFSSTESTAEIPSINNPKSLQSRRSLLDILQPDKVKPASTSSIPSSSNASVESEGNVEEPPTKRQKMEENEGNESDDEASADSREPEEEGETEGGGDSGSQKSQEEKESPSQSPEANIEERNIPHAPSVLTPSATLNKELFLESAPEPAQDPVSQQFKRVREDSENTCARTDLVYVHPPAHEKEAIIDPQKTIPAHIQQLNFGSSSTSTQPNHIIPPSSSPVHPPGFPNQPIRPTQPHMTHTQPRPVIPPTITPHDPALPQFINFLGPTHPMTPIGTPFLGIPPGSAGIGIQPATATGPIPQHMEKDEMMWRMTAALQQQKHLEIAAQAQVQAHQLPHSIHFHPPLNTPHHHPPTAGTTAGPQQQLIFQFPPNTEEIAHPQRHLQTLMQAPSLPQIVATTPSIPVEARTHEEQTIPTVQFAAIHPMELMQQQLLIQHQQQQMAAAATAAGHLPDLAELKQQVEIIVQQSQKDPTILNHPQARTIMAQYQTIQDSIMQQQQMHELMVHHHLQQQQQQEALKQQHKHQQQTQSKYPQTAMRPGVIIGHPK